VLYRSRSRTGNDDSGQTTLDTRIRFPRFAESIDTGELGGSSLCETTGRMNVEAHHCVDFAIEAEGVCQNPSTSIAPSRSLEPIRRRPIFCKEPCFRVSGPEKEDAMPRQRSLVTVVRDMVQREVRSAIQSLLGSISTGKTKPKHGRRRRKARGRWRPGGPGRAPTAVAAKAAQKKSAAVKLVARKAKTGRRRRRRRRGPGRPPGSKKKAA